MAEKIRLASFLAMPFIILAVVFVVVAGFFGVQAVTKFKDRADFVRKLRPDAKIIERETGIPADLIITQAALESGNGNSGLAQKYKNLFGIKAGSSWNGARVTLKTTEYVNGKAVKVPADFRAYPSFRDSLRDWVRFLSKDRYRLALEAAKRGQAELFFYALREAGYATDPKYPEKLAAVYKKVIEVA